MASWGEPAFAGDDGAIDPALAAGFEASSGPDDTAPIIGALCQARILTAVVAVAGHDPTDSDKGAEMSAVFMRGADGRTGLIAFSSLTAMQQWNPQARPVPVRARQAAQAALSEGAEALLLDVGTPQFTVVEGEDLTRLAEGWRLVHSAAGYAWIQ